MTRNRYSLKPARELWQLASGIQWMASAIPDLAGRVALLCEHLKTTFIKAGKRSRKFLQEFQLSELVCSQEHNSGIDDLNEQLKNAVKITLWDTISH